jgi:hypothetical protein
VPVGMGVVFPMLTEQVCEMQGHGMRLSAGWL